MINPILMAAFLILSTIALGFVAVIWSNDGWPNVFLKMLYSGLTIVGVFISLKFLGWI
jgi:hypothetical protein